MDRPGAFCIYCFDQNRDQLSKSHLFPQSIGGRIAARYSCHRCNNLIGTSIEGALKAHLVLAHGICSLGIQPPAKAYDRIPIRDRESKERLKHVDDKLMGTSKIREKNGTKMSRVAPPKEMRRLISNDVKKKYPEEWEQYMREYDAGKRVLRVGNEQHEFRMETKRGEVEFEGKASVPMGLLAKIVFEAVWAFQQFDAHTIQEFHQSTIRIDREPSDGVVNGIQFDQSFASRVWCITQDVSRGRIPLNDIAFRKYHRIDFRVTENGIAYVRVGFFGVLSYIVAFGKLETDKPSNTELLDRAIIFPVEECAIVPEEYPLEYKDIRTRDDIMARIAWDRYQSCRSGALRS